MRPSDTSIALIAGGMLFAVVGASIMGHSYLFLGAGLVVVMILVRMMVRS